MGPQLESRRFHYDRLTEPYRPVHALCRWILAGTRLGLGEPHAVGASFVVEMAPLFERFVSLSLRTRLQPPWRARSPWGWISDRIGRQCKTAWTGWQKPSPDSNDDETITQSGPD